MNSLIKDLRYGVRGLMTRPGFTVVAVITLALGIGANTAIFSVVNGVVLRPLSYKEPDRVVSLWERVPGYGQWRVAPANFFDWKKQNTVFTDVAAFGASTLTLTGGGEPEQLLGTRASEGYFSVVGVEPMLGRSFAHEEYEPGKGRVVVLGHAFWARRFAANREIVGKTITLDDQLYTVVGVMPEGIYPVWPTTSGHISFDQAEQQFWIPMSFTAQWAGVRTAHVLGVVARLKPGVTIQAAQAEMNTINARLEQEYAANKGEGIIVNPFMNEVVGNVKPALLILFGAVGLVLLISCANIAGLLLAQYASRSKEIAIRAALGAGRGRLVRQFFIEGLLVSVLGSTLGVVLAIGGVDLILKLIPQQIPRLNQVRVDLPVLLFTFLLSLLTCIAFGLLPSWHASKPQLQEALDQGGRASGAGVGRQNFRRLLVVFQVSVAVILVIGAGLLIKTFWQLRQVDPGFKSEHVLSLTITLPQAKYSDNTQINNFYNQLIERIQNLPGVRSAAIAYDHPLQANWVDGFAIEGKPVSDTTDLSANFNPVSYDYFRTLGTSVLRGRQFTAQDDPDHPGVAIVNEAFARRYFPNEEVIGQRLRPNPPARIWQNRKLTSFEIVGIARDVKSAGLKADPEPTYYIPASQAPLPDMSILVRAEGDPTSLVPSLRGAVLSIDANQPIATVNTLDQIVSDSIAQPRLNMVLMVLFGGLALLLAAVGVYGLLSFAVTQRVQEIGIRMALGAQVSDVLKLVIRHGMVLVLAGELIGLVGAIVLTRLMSGLLFGVTPTDATTFALVLLGLALVALIACYIPARRAAKVDPLTALRNE
jgi:predicted permease